MKLFQNEKFLRIVLTVFGVTALGASFLHLFTGLHIPGLEPLVSAAFWFFLWQWYRSRGKFPGGIYTFLYLAIIALNLYSGFTQLRLAFV